MLGGRHVWALCVHNDRVHIECEIRGSFADLALLGGLMNVGWTGTSIPEPENLHGGHGSSALCGRLVVELCIGFTLMI